MWLYEGDEFQMGDNQLSIEEKMLCEAYEQRGRNDLAECVRNGRVYQRLRYILHCGDFVTLPDSNVLGGLNGLTSAINPTAVLPSSLTQWEEQAMKQHSANPDLTSVMELDARLKITRQPAQPEATSEVPTASELVTSPHHTPISTVAVS